MTPVQLQQLEGLTEKAYTSPSHAERTQAEEALKVFATPEYLPQCRFILDNSHSDYATLFAGSSIMKVLTNNWNSFTVSDRIDIHILCMNMCTTNSLIITTKLFVKPVSHTRAHHITVS
jgi:Importin-beta N-terminal domain